MNKVYVLVMRDDMNEISGLGQAYTQESIAEVVKDNKNSEIMGSRWEVQEITVEC